MRILFMGHGKWACITLEALVKQGHEIVGVVCELDSFDKRESEHYKRLTKADTYASLKDLTKKLKLNLFQPESVNSKKFIEKVKKLGPELIVMVSYHAIIKDELLELYKDKIINVHGAPLPYYRGRAPINWAIINGEDQTGITIHFISKYIDQGDIIAQEIIPIEEHETAGDVLKKTLECYPRLTLKAVEMIEKGTIKRTKQRPGEGSYYPKRKPEDGVIDWSKDSKQLYNWVRALTHPYPGAFTFLNGKKLFIWKASPPNEKQEGKKENPGTVIGNADNGVKVRTGDSCIIIEKAQLEGGEEKSAGEILKIGAKLGK